MDPARKSLFDRHSVAILIGIATVVICVGTGVNLWFGRAAGQIAKEQFNAEQLLVARNVRYWIERQMAVLSRELVLLVKNLERGSADPLTLYLQLEPTFERVEELGVDRIELVDVHGHEKYIYYPFRIQPERSIPAPDESAPAIATVTGGTSEMLVREVAGSGLEMQLILSAPVSHPSLARVSFQINLSWFLSPFLKHIRSGKSGYAWIIDDQGRFLFHPHAPFIGRSAFEARRERDPGISLHKIETIQKESMIKGLEGTGTYVAAWHRGATGPVEKLIAYTPISISESPPIRWSVAVVAPVYEIEAAMGRIHRLQAFLQAVVLLVGVAAGSVYFFQMRWRRRVEEWMAIRSQALKRCEEKCRRLMGSAEELSP